LQAHPRQGKRKKDQGKLFPDATKPNEVVPELRMVTAAVRGPQRPRIAIESAPAHDFRGVIIAAVCPLPYIPCQPFHAFGRDAVWQQPDRSSVRELVAEKGEGIAGELRPPRIFTLFLSARREFPLLLPGHNQRGNSAQLVARTFPRYVGLIAEAPIRIDVHLQGKMLEGEIESKFLSLPGKPVHVNAVKNSRPTDRRTKQSTKAGEQ